MRIPARSLGLYAQQTLAVNSTASVTGVTSRGLFILSPRNQVIFLSFEPWRGPLTINLNARYPILETIPSGALVQLMPTTIEIPSARVSIDFVDAPVWSARRAPVIAQPETQRLVKLHEVTHLIITRAGHGSGSILPVLLGMTEKTNLSADQETLLAYASDLQKALLDRHISHIVAAASRLLGYGHGLTPSGDDLLTGFLLALNRWAYRLYDSDQLQEINSHVTRNAYAQTTSLSANLIAAAARGQADERLVTALDALFTSQPDSPAVANILLSYGGSSGVDTLLGYAIVLSI